MKDRPDSGRGASASVSETLGVCAGVGEGSAEAEVAVDPFVGQGVPMGGWVD